jgi:hypothetical protein
MSDPPGAAKADGSRIGWLPLEALPRLPASDHYRRSAHDRLQ